MRNRITSIFCALYMMTGMLCAQSFETAASAVANMRVGWNLGNTLESNSGDVNNMWIEAWTDRSPSAYETAWGQAVTTQNLIKMFKDAGFNAIRVPVTWYPHMEATFNSVKWDNSKNALAPWDPSTDDIGTKIQATWMSRVHEVVDYVISQGMYCILNVHHDTGASNTAWLIASTSDYNKQKDRFEAVWKQIAEEFKDYDEHLLFEGYNEMLDKYRSWCFASYGISSHYNATDATDAYNAINSYAQSFVDAVRATGGNNAQRNLIVSTYGGCSGEGNWNDHLQDPLKKMNLPTDAATNHIAFEIHAYPSIKNGLNNAKTSVSAMMDALSTHLASKGAPIIIGEWGTANDIESGKDDLDVRPADKIAFARYFVEQAKAKGFAPFYWMGLSDGTHRSVPEFNQEDLKEAIIKGYYGDQGYTGISQIKEDCRKTTETYDLQGRKIRNPQHGIYIQNGKKYIAK